MSKENRPIYEFKKNAGESIRFSLVEYENREYVDIRTFGFWDDESRATKKGVRFAVEELWSKFVAGVHEVDKAIEEDSGNA